MSNNIQKNTYVFLGPTLSLSDARNILPEANYLPPIKCGDLLRVIELNPKVIAIIDGVFENYAAVWHKEILFCLEKNINVYGASSMGALRAAELSTYGMIGIGKVFELFNSEIFNDDDEVAIVHTAYPDYVSLSDAMVNIRATLNNAVDAKIISIDFSEKITDEAKKLFYRDRTLSKAIEIVQQNFSPSDMAQKFSNWLEGVGHTDIKRQDALQLLKHLATRNSEAEPNNKFVHVPKTVFLRTMQRNNRYQSCFNLVSPMIINSENENSHNEFIRIINLSSLLGIVYGWSDINYNINDYCGYSSEDWLDAKKYLADATDLTRHELSPSECGSILQRTEKIEKLLWLMNKSHPDFTQRIASNFLLFLKICGNYTGYIKNNSTLLNTYNLRTIKLTALLWTLLASIIDSFKLTLKEEVIDRYMVKFRKKRALHTKESILEWIINQDLTYLTYKKMIELYAFFSFIVSDGNFELFGIFEIENAGLLISDARMLVGL